MDGAELLVQHLQEAEEIVMISIHEGKITVFSSLLTEAAAIELMTKAQEQLLLKIITDRRKKMEEAAAEQTKKVLDSIDKKFH